MHVIRTIVWVLLIVVLLVFSYNNWNPVVVKIWDGLLLETAIPVLVATSFLLGLVPMWLLSKAGHWRLTRRINALENSMRAATVPLMATTTQLDEEAPAREDKLG